MAQSGDEDGEHKVFVAPSGGVQTVHFSSADSEKVDRVKQASLKKKVDLQISR